MRTTQAQALSREGLFHRFSKSLPVARVQSDHVGELCRFFKRAYADQPLAVSFQDDTLVRRRWRWLYESIPVSLDGELPGWICMYKGRIVGYLGTLPAVAAVQDRAVPICWVRDLIVASDARQLGIGPLLIMAAMRAVQRPCLVGGLNEDSFTLFKQLGFKDFGTIPFYCKVNEPQRFLETLPWSPLARRVAVLAIRVGQALKKQPFGWRRWNTPLDVVPMEQFDARFDRWWTGVEPMFACVVRRTAEMMNWRYHHHPTHQYRVVAAMEGQTIRGILVMRHGWSRGLPTGFITELLAHPGDQEALDSLLDHAEQWLAEDQESRPVFIRCAVHHPAFEQALARAGFLRAPSPFRWMTSCDGNQPNLRELQRQENWFLSTGDSDLDFF